MEELREIASQLAHLNDTARMLLVAVVVGAAETPVDRCGEELARLQGDAWFARRVAVAAAEAFATINGDLDACSDAYQRVGEMRQNLALAEARLAGARQLAEALGLVAKVTP